MSDLERFQEIVDELWLIVFGTIRRPEVQIKEAMKEKPKRARTKKGRYKADDPTTKGINEAWVGGKSPKKRKKK